MKKLCCFCNDEVLGIFGQDDVLDSFYLRAESEDEKAIAERIYGNSHISCLLNSGWSEFWFKRRVENLVSVRRYECVHRDDSIEILRHPLTGDIAISPFPGVLLGVSDQQVRTGLDVSRSLLSVRQPEKFWKLPDGAIVEGVQSIFHKGGILPLVELERLYGVEDHLFDAGGAAFGELSAIETKTDEGLSRGLLIASVLAVVSLPSDLAGRLHKLINHG